MAVIAEFEIVTFHTRIVKNREQFFTCKCLFKNNKKRLLAANYMKYTVANANSLFIHEHVIIVKREHTLLTICICCARNIYRSLFLFPSIPNDISMVCERFSKSDTCMSNMFDRVDDICHVNNFACKQFVCFRLLHAYLDNIKICDPLMENFVFSAKKFLLQLLFFR